MGLPHLTSVSYLRWLWWRRLETRENHSDIRGIFLSPRTRGIFFFIHAPPLFVGLWVLLGRCKHFEASPEGDLSSAGPITAGSKELCFGSSPPRTPLKWQEGEDSPIDLLRFPPSLGDDNCFRVSEFVRRNDQPLDIWWLVSRYICEIIQKISDDKTSWKL